MKKAYEKPSFEVELFGTDEILTGSIGPGAFTNMVKDGQLTLEGSGTVIKITDGNTLNSMDYSAFKKK